MKERDQHLVLAALKATDNYLGVLKDAEKRGASGIHIHNFTAQYTNAHAALSAIDKINEHEPYMKNHLNDMLKISGDEDLTLADEPYTHAPAGGGGDVDEDFGGARSYQNTSDYIINPKSGKKQRTGKVYFYTETDPEEEKAKSRRQREIEKNRQLAAANQSDKQVSEIANILNEKSYKSGISVSVLLEVYTRAIEQNADPLAEVNSYILKGKSYLHNTDLNEQDYNITDLDIDNIIDLIEWEDIEDLFTEEDVEEIEEGLSATTRMKKSQRFKMSSVKRQVQKNLKLGRTADQATLKNRAKVAVRRALMKKFLRGRNKAQLSAQEKDRIETQIRSMKNIVGMMAQKMLPKVQKLQQQRLASRGKKK
jgi:hypothetical protein